MSGASGGASHLEVTASQLQDAAKEIDTAQSDLTSIAGKLEQQLAPMAARWTGAGSNAFFEFFNAWHEKEKKIVDILTHFSQSIGATNQTTTQVDDEQQANFNKIAGRLG